MLVKIFIVLWCFFKIPEGIAEVLPPYPGDAWLKLLHYETSGNKEHRRFQSRVESENFFMHTSGRFDPEKEWNTLLHEISIGQQRVDALYCRFPMRLKLIQRHVFPSLILNDCNLLKTWHKKLSPAKISLLFASQYSGNPASRFGHTFLRFKQNTYFAGREIMATDPILNFAARIPDDTGPIRYVLDGLFGGFVGLFSVNTFSEKIDEYNNVEDRDIWEYELNLSPETINDFVLHLYELRGMQWTYWFLDENCAYQLLAVIEAVRPDLELLDGLPPYVLPIAIIEAAMEFQLVDKINYYPSIASILQNSLNELSAEEKEKFFDPLITGEIIPSPSPTYLESLIHYIDYQNSKEKFQSASLDDLKTAALWQRSKLPKRSDFSIMRPARLKPPHHGAPISLYEIGYTSQTHTSGMTFRFLPLMHDLMGSDAGVNPNEELRILDSQWIIETNSKNRIHLDYFTFLSNVVLNPVSLTNHSISWDIELSLKEHDAVTRNRVFECDPKVGWSFFSPATLYLLAGYTAKVESQGNNEFYHGPTFQFGSLVSSPKNKLNLGVEIWREIKESNTNSRTFYAEYAYFAAKSWQINASASVTHSQFPSKIGQQSSLSKYTKVSTGIAKLF